MTDSAGQDELILRRLDREWSEAYPRGDAAALGRILADDWTAIDGSGAVVTKREILERVAAAGAQRLDRCEFDEETLRLFGDAAVTTGRMRVSGRDVGGEFSFEQRFTRVYAPARKR